MHFWQIHLLTTNDTQSWRKKRRKEGMGFYVAFNSLDDETETWNREEIPFSSRIVPRGLLVAEEP